MAYIQFISGQLQTKEEIFISIMNSAYKVDNLESIYFQKHSEEININKVYIENSVRVEESINFLRQDIDTYNKYLKFSDEENPCIILDIVENKKMISLFSADKVRFKILLFEFAKEYLKLHPENYLLVDEIDLYDLKRLESLT